MKRRGIRAFGAGLIALVMAAFIFIPAMGTVVSADGGTEGDVPLSAYYCRARLAELENGEALVYAYDKICEGVDSCLTDVEVYNGEDPISQDELAVVMDAYRRDRADQFWLSNSYTIRFTSETVTEVVLSYLMTGAELDRARAAFDERMEGYLALLTPEMTDIEKELTLHDALLRDVVYIESAHAHNAYGAMVLGEAVCEGYAEALQCLLHRVGIPCFIALGSSINPSTGTGEPHAWCCVEIDGDFYHLDPTWNDQGEDIFHAYFNLTDVAISADHAVTAPLYPVPVCDSTDAWYYNSVKNELAAPYTAEAVAALFDTASYKAFLYPSTGVEDFRAWLSDSENVLAVADLLGISGEFSYGSSALGGEIKLVLNACDHGSLTPVAPTEPTCIKAGNIAYYECACGALFLDAEATVPTDRAAVRLAPDGVHAFLAECDGYCEDCGKTRPVGAHSYDDVCDGECNGCGQNREAPHDYENGCDTVCGLCSEEREAPHEFEGPCDTSCLCGQSTRTAEHSFEDGCATNCTLCGQLRIPPHEELTWVYDADGHYRSCTCGFSTEPEAHSFKGGRCTECDYPEEGEFEYEMPDFGGMFGKVKGFFAELKGGDIAAAFATAGVTGYVTVALLLLLPVFLILIFRKRK